MLSSKAKYGLKAMVHLARREGLGAILIADIAEAERIPRKFLDAILLELKLQGLLVSKKGKGGGYALAKSASSIAVGDIIRILDGPLAPVPCVSRQSYRRCDDCVDEQSCAVKAVMQDVRDALSQILDNTNLAELSTRRPDPPGLQYEI
jgi:Rrf2 family protein